MLPYIKLCKGFSLSNHFSDTSHIGTVALFFFGCNHNRKQVFNKSAGIAASYTYKPCHVFNEETVNLAKVLE